MEHYEPDSRPLSTGRLLLAKIGVAAVMLICLMQNANSAGLEKPTGEVLLKIKGNISNTNVDGEALFDLKMLQALGITEFSTETPWTEGMAKFEGVLIKTLFEAVGAGSADFEAIAINKYQYEFGQLDYEEYPLLLAWKLNDELLTVRTLGPLWLMFPYSDYPEIDNEIYRNAAVWQLIEIFVN